MWVCPKCGKKYPITVKFCKDCGTKLIEKQANTCSNSACPDFKISLDDKQKYCGECGSPTTYWIKIEKNC